MLTFEDFFKKKKIDLEALQRDNAELYQEFYAHYQAMGEKSFDHTKKFWFNRLRKSYKLDEPEVIAPKAVDDSSGSAVPTPTSTSKTLGFRPKFRPATAKSDTQPASSSAMAEQSPVGSPPAGFKPRFKTGVTKAAAPVTDATDTPAKSVDEAPTAVPSKPAGFKPRFKAGVTKAAAPVTDATDTPAKSADEAPTAVPSKPAGFKPRFKAGVTKAATPVTDATDTPAKSADEAPTAVPSKPAGFKPRFKAGVTKIQKDDSTNSDDKPST